MKYTFYEVPTELSITHINTFFKRKCGKNYVFPGETHNFWECLLVLSGSVCASGDGRVYNLKPGNMICHKPMELHRFYTTSPIGAEILVFSFHAEGSLTRKLRDKVFRLSETENAVVDMLISMSEALSVPNSDGSFVNYNHYPDREFFETAACYIKLLLLSLIRGGENKESAKSADAAVFSDAVGFMSNHVDKNPTVDEISAAVKTSPTALKRIFAKYAGIGIHKYFLTLKLKAADDLLKEGKTVTETAYLLGFSDQGYFSRAFFRETGLHPSDIKKAELKAPLR